MLDWTYFLNLFEFIVKLAKEIVRKVLRGQTKNKSKKPENETKDETAHLPTTSNDIRMGFNSHRNLTSMQGVMLDPQLSWKARRGYN